VTPKRKRMVNVLDVLETIKLPSTTPKKTAKTSEASAEVSVAKASKQQAVVENWAFRTNQSNTLGSRRSKNRKGN
jgi:hypothetical protein